MTANSQKVAKFCSVLNHPHSLNILADLIQKRKHYTYFKTKYGYNTRYTVSELVRADVIRKILDAAKIPIGYKITAHGRWLYHACMDFQKKLESYP